MVDLPFLAGVAPLTAPEPTGSAVIDGPALQAATNQVLVTGQKLILQGGSVATGGYKFSQLTVNMDNLGESWPGISIEGQGVFGTELVSDGTASPAINFTSSVSSARRLVLDGVHIHYTAGGMGGAGVVSVQLWNQLHWTIRDSIIYGDKAALSIQGSGNGTLQNTEVTLNAGASAPYCALWIGCGNSTPGSNDGTLTSSGPVQIFGGQVTSSAGVPAGIVEGGAGVPGSFSIGLYGTQYQANGGAQVASWKIDGTSTSFEYHSPHGESNYNSTNTGVDFLIGSISKPGHVGIYGGTAWGQGNGVNYQNYFLDVVACKSLTVTGLKCSKQAAAHGYDGGLIHFRAGYPAAGDIIEITPPDRDTVTGPVYADANNVIPATYTGAWRFDGQNYAPFLAATTGPNGTALINGAATPLTWTAPNDGRLHRVTIYGVLSVTGAATGGAINVSNGSTTHILIAGNQAVGDQFGAGGSVTTLTLKPGQTVSVTQTALTAGAATFYGEIWAS